VARPQAAGATPTGWVWNNGVAAPR
jgi:hypothetical protein